MWTLVFNPSLITYDYHTSYTWKDLDRKIKKNKIVKEFREAVGYTHPKYKEGDYVGDFGGYHVLVGGKEGTYINIVNDLNEMKMKGLDE